jgi:hypothetical protein
MSTTSYPAGWYQNPHGLGERYFDGQQWTSSIRVPAPVARRRPLWPFLAAGAILVAVAGAGVWWATRDTQPSVYEGFATTINRDVCRDIDVGDDHLYVTVPNHLECQISVGMVMLALGFDDQTYDRAHLTGQPAEVAGRRLTVDDLPDGSVRVKIEDQ